MSLNGLDSDAVIQAHQNALAETGGWFLLHYVSRDTVELLGQGSGGVSETRRVVESYQEKSPLYGVVQCRRKKFILKYVPEGTSRLLQVRLAVQFQSILDTFTPHDTVFSFIAAHELSESALGLSTIIQSSVASRSSKTSSSSSLHQQRLDEITEDLEEGQSVRTKTVNAPEMPSPTDPLPSSATRAKALLAIHKQKWEQDLPDSNRHFSASSAGTAQILCTPSPDLNASTRLSSVATNKDLPLPPPEPSSSSPSKTNSADLRPSFDSPLPQLESDSDDDVRRPVPKQYSQMRYSAHLSAAESNSISMWSNEVLASTAKSKQKRVPKAAADVQVRPRTSGNSDEVKESRRANLPTTVRVSNRSSGQSSRPGSRQSTRSVPARLMPTPDLAPPMPLPTSMAEPRRGPSAVRPSTSQGPSYTHEAPGITPEKMRLMKALQMRKRTQLLMQRCNTAPPETTNPLLTSTDSSQSTISDLSVAASAPLSLEFARDPLFQAPELVVKHESSGTSPTSIVTTSDNHSTKPSSFSNDSLKNASRTSLSSETGSSTTPKAENENENTQHQKIKGVESTEPVPGALKQTTTDPRMELTIEPGEDKVGDKSRLNRPLTYHCATADFLADIEEEDRTLPVFELEAGHAPTISTPEVEETKNPYSLEALVATPQQHNANTSDESDDESLIEELQNATVHEAKPMSVNRTPATPVLSNASTRTSTYELSSEPPSANSDRSLSKRPMRNPSRSTSNDSQMSPPDLKRSVSRAGSTRSLSTALPQWPPPPTEPIPTLPKQRPVVGVGISKRVKTFEGLSQRDSLTLLPPQKDQVPRSTSLSNMLKRASFLYTHSDDISEKSNTKTMPSLRTDFENNEHDSSQSQPWLQRPGTSTDVYSPTYKGETVSVSAQIVQDPIKPLSAHGTSDTPRIMQASPLVGEHATGSNLDLRPPLPREHSTQSIDSLATSTSPSERRRFSFSSHKSSAQKLSPIETMSHRLSFTTHKKLPKSPTGTASGGDEKKQSRTSRMLKRLSGLGKTRSQRDPTLSPTRDEPQPDIIEESADMRTESETEMQVESDPQLTRHVVDIGEVNVQFVETLLWKRRFLRVDDQGYLIFAPPSNDFSTRGKSRKIHLEELHKPSLPDHEREEMAWSILLDLKSGGTVQCACESKSAQRSVLKMLLDAHNAYHQLYG